LLAKQDLPFGDFSIAGQHAQNSLRKRTLARSGRTENTQDFSLADFKIKGAECVHACTFSGAIRNTQPGDAQ
jgi:hypothetical protein